MSQHHNHHNGIDPNTAVNIGTSVAVGITVAHHPRLFLRPLWFVLLYFGISQLFGFGWTLLGMSAAADLHTPNWFYFLFGLIAFFTSEGYWIGRLVR